MKSKLLKRSISVGLAACMAVAGMSGCGKSSTGSTASSGSSNEIYTIRYVTPGNEPNNMKQILDAVNKKMLKDGLKVQLDVVRVPWDAWDQKTNLMFANGEKVDLIHVMQDQKPASYLLSKNYVLPLNDYLKDFPDLSKKFDAQMWKEVSLNGKIGAIPAAWKLFTAENKAEGNLFYRTDVLKKLGLSIPKTPDELLTTTVKMKSYVEKQTGQKAYFNTMDVKYPAYWLERSYNTYPFYVDMSTNLFKINQNGTVDSWFESNEFKSDAQYFRKMYQAGLINPDLLSKNDYQDVPNKGTVLFGDCFNYSTQETLRDVAKIPDATIESGKLGSDKTVIVPMMVGNANAIPKSCKNPKAVLQFLNWLYSSAENHNLFIFGIEGQDYTKVSGSDRKIDIKKDASGSPVYSFDSWQIGYYPYMLYDKTTPDAMIKDFTTPREAGTYEYSPAAGFMFDESSVTTEMANLRSVIVTSMYPIKFGFVDYDTAYPKAIAQLKAAGLDKVMQEYQKQFKAYLAANK